MDGFLPVPRSSSPALPAVIADAGEPAAMRFIEFFTANIRNPNTRQAYARAVMDFFGWCERHGIGPLPAIQPVHVAAYVEELTRSYAAPTVKQRLAAIRMLFDWFIVGQVVPHNPAAAVRGPRHVVTQGKTPVLTPEETRQLLDSLPAETITGLRDRALIGLLVYTFARIGAAVISTARTGGSGCGSTRRAASSTPCRRTITLSSISTTTCRPAASPAIPRGRSSAPCAGAPRSSRGDASRPRTPGTWCAAVPGRRVLQRP